MCNIQIVDIAKKDLTVAAEAECIVPFPGGRLGGVVVAVAFPETTVLLSNTCETASLPALVHRLGDPVDPWIPADLDTGILSVSGGAGEPSKAYGLVIGINEDDLVIFVDTILVNPVRVQDSQVATTPPNTLFRNTSQSTLGLEVIYTLMDRFTVCGTCEAFQYRSMNQELSNMYPWGRASCGYPCGREYGR